jgi:hypothetical protein
MTSATQEVLMSGTKKGRTISSLRSVILKRLKERGVRFPNCPKNNILIQVAEAHLGPKLPRAGVKTRTQRQRLMAIAAVLTGNSIYLNATGEKRRGKPKNLPVTTMRVSAVNARGISENMIDEFYKSYEWRRIRYDVLQKNDGRCELCGRSKHDGIVLNVDHIKPLRLHWELRLSRGNLQILCNECNHGKGNRDKTDWRPRASALGGA